ncbi:MAG: putative concanavalin A-like lectin/glucanases superfamily protein [Prokaryotic dsDNA virus sp.]|jgi:hypothetical protein|nr:MAG: putative concanavalin A-like lectin/glucanases superfamily protein [Prokaryotic dsDNA virus sp.]|tara:strand:+ start:21327 stop:22610 length:1284 start_codon:yes stop_codon:yes gene_type:complete
MTILNHSTPAERERYLSWTSNFNDAQKIVEEGGAFTGSPTYNQGVVLDGSNDYVSYNNVDSKFDSSTVSIVVKFSPEFALADGNNHYIFSTTSEDYRLYKTTTNRLQLTLGNTLIANINVDAAWNGNGDNIVVVTGESTNTDVWLNGTQVLTSDASAWSQVNVTELYIGAASNGVAKFQGTIREFKVFKTKLTDDEAEQISDGSTYDYINETVLDVPLNLANHDATNEQVIDISAEGNDMDWGTGAAATFPTKNTQTQGYSFDGGDFFVVSSGLGITDYPFTMSCMFSNTAAGISAAIDLADSTDGARNYSIYVDTNEIVKVAQRNGGGWATAGTVVGDKGEWIHVVAVFGSATSRIIYINGREDGEDTTSVAFFTPNRFTIGRLGDLTPSSMLTGEIAKVKVWDSELTPLQVSDLYFRDLKQFSEV